MIRIISEGIKIVLRKQMKIYDERTEHMSVNAVNSIGTNPYLQQSDTQRTGKTEGEFEKKVMTCVSAGGQKCMLRSDALMSYASPQTGESVNIYKASNYSKENPVYIIMGLDAGGNEFRKEIDASKINPGHCSYNELMVLNVENGHTSDNDRLHAVAVHDKAGMGSFFDSRNYLLYIQKVMEDQKVMGNWSSYLAYGKWMERMVKRAW